MKKSNIITSSNSTFLFNLLTTKIYMLTFLLTLFFLPNLSYAVQSLEIKVSEARNAQNEYLELVLENYQHPVTSTVINMLCYGIRTIFSLEEARNVLEAKENSLAESIEMVLATKSFFPQSLKKIRKIRKKRDSDIAQLKKAYYEKLTPLPAPLQDEIEDETERELRHVKRHYIDKPLKFTLRQIINTPS